MSSEWVSRRRAGIRNVDSMAIAVTVRGDDLAAARRLARFLEAVTDDIEVVAVALTADDAARAVTDLLPDVVLIDVRPEASAGPESPRLQALSPSTRTLVLTSDE